MLDMRWCLGVLLLLGNACSQQAPPAAVSCSVGLAEPPVQYRPWRLSCTVEAPVGAPHKVCGVRVNWHYDNAGEWVTRPEVGSKTPGCIQTCWPVEPHPIPIVGGSRKTEFEYVFSDPVAIAWPGRYRVSLMVSFVAGPGAEEFVYREGLAPENSRVRWISSGSVDVDVQPAASSIRSELDASRDAFGPKWKSYVHILSVPVVSLLEPSRPPAEPPAFVTATASQLGLSLNPPPIDPAVWAAAAGIGPEYELLAKIYRARLECLAARSGGPLSHGHLEEASTLLSQCGALVVAEERRAAALVMHAHVRQVLGPPLMVQQLKAQATAPALLPRLRKHRWFDREVRQFLGMQ